MSDADLLREVARRRLAKGVFDRGAIEELAEAAQRDLGEETLVAAIAALPPEDSSPKPCPKCRQLVPVKAKNRLRHILTVAGELRLTRNYHHCGHCNLGFYPRDAELKLPEGGEVSDAMKRRILDFGINDTFESVVERWSIHYPMSISSNLVRRVVDRVGLRCEAAHSEESLQLACREKSDEPAKMLVVATDGSMVLTREEGWKEAKVGVVARGERVVEAKKRRIIEDARYVAVLGGQEVWQLGRPHLNMVFRPTLAARVSAASVTRSRRSAGSSGGACPNREAPALDCAVLRRRRGGRFRRPCLGA